MDSGVKEFIQMGVLIVGFGITFWNTNKASRNDHSLDEVTKENHKIRITNLEDRVGSHEARINALENVQYSIQKIEAYSKDHKQELKDLRDEVASIKIDIAAKKEK